ncbi:MAG TPA: DegT/DnrJ/EryC1/StrS family aminotransferase [Burkholderiales bacterium]|nr:DegT/DnrJ/EryC1/StrS family aminotransferase [Burkholderiales bacterium]
MSEVKAVPFLDLSTPYKALEAEWLDAIRAAGQSGAFILGPNVAAFEKEIAAYVGAKHAVACANGTDALVLSLRALGVGPGDEIITSPFTFFASAEVITLVGAKPVFADIEADSYDIDPASVRKLVTAKTKAIIPVHLYGYPAKMDELLAIAREHKLTMIEDCAQAFGAEVGGRRVGVMGDTGSFSFYPTKVLGCYGDGGAITTNRPELDEHLRRLRNHGAYKPFMHNEIGYNSRLDEIQAALLRIKLRGIDNDIAGRNSVAAEYDKRLKPLGVTLPSRPSNGRHVFNLYTIRVKERDRVRQYLTDNKVASSVCYPKPLHLQDVYQSLGYRAGSLPVSEQAATETLCLPIYPGMPVEHIQRVADVLSAALKG